VFIFDGVNSYEEFRTELVLRKDISSAELFFYNFYLIKHPEIRQLLGVDVTIRKKKKKK